MLLPSNLAATQNTAHIAPKVRNVHTIPAALGESCQKAPRISPGANAANTIIVDISFKLLLA